MGPEGFEMSQNGGYSVFLPFSLFRCCPRSYPSMSSVQTRSVVWSYSIQMLSPTHEKKRLLGFLRTSKANSPSRETTPETTNRSHKAPPTPPQSPIQNCPNQALTIRPEVPESQEQAIVPFNRTPESPQLNISLAPQRSRSTVSRASVARVSTIIREANKTRPGNAPEYHQVKDTDREFWSTTLRLFEYTYLLERVHKNKELGDFFDQELRYGFD
jgi:hypothetical protein